MSTLTPVTSFDELRALIASCPAGDDGRHRPVATVRRN